MRAGFLKRPNRKRGAGLEIFWLVFLLYSGKGGRTARCRLFDIGREAIGLYQHTWTPTHVGQESCSMITLSFFSSRSWRLIAWFGARRIAISLSMTSWVPQFKQRKIKEFRVISVQLLQTSGGADVSKSKGKNSFLHTEHLMPNLLAFSHYL